MFDFSSIIFIFSIDNLQLQRQMAHRERNQSNKQIDRQAK